MPGPSPPPQAPTLRRSNGRALLEELLDDDDELAQLNLSSRPQREDKQRKRERERLQRGQEW